MFQKLWRVQITKNSVPVRIHRHCILALTLKKIFQLFYLKYFFNGGVNSSLALNTLVPPCNRQLSFRTQQLVLSHAYKFGFNLENLKRSGFLKHRKNFKATKKRRTGFCSNLECPWCLASCFDYFSLRSYERKLDILRKKCLGLDQNAFVGDC